MRYCTPRILSRAMRSYEGPKDVLHFVPSDKAAYPKEGCFSFVLLELLNWPKTSEIPTP